MKKTALLFLCLIWVAGSLWAKEVEKLGKPLAIKEVTKVSDILENPEKFVGKDVKVSGVVLDVCKHRGCWMTMASDKPQQTITVKVKDGVIVFPLTAKGKKATVEGTVYKIELSKEQCMKYEEHKCKEQGKKFDPSKVKGPMTVYQIKGKGAEIELD